MNKLIKISSILATVVLVVLMMVSSCCKKQTIPKSCVAPQIFKYGTCVNDSTKGVMVNGSWLPFGDLTIPSSMPLWQAQGTNCGDWRDSVMLGGAIDSTMDRLFIAQYPSILLPNYSRSSLLEITDYKLGIQYDSFWVTLGVLAYGSGSIGPGIPLSCIGSINKGQDSIRLRLYNVNIAPQFTLLDYCDKLLVKTR
jgi:hypothetical protein